MSLQNFDYSLNDDKSNPVAKLEVSHQPEDGQKKTAFAVHLSPHLPEAARKDALYEYQALAKALEFEPGVTDNKTMSLDTTGKSPDALMIFVVSDMESKKFIPEGTLKEFIEHLKAEESAALEKSQAEAQLAGGSNHLAQAKNVGAVLQNSGAQHTSHGDLHEPAREKAAMDKPAIPQSARLLTT
jgi:hypothetical protein